MNAPFPGDPPAGFRRVWLRRDWGWQHLLAGGQGEPLVLVHGLGGSHLDFAAMLPALASRYTCLVPDQPGFGLSTKPDVDYSIEFMTGAMAGLAAELGLFRARWLGHSLGGQVTLWLAATRPELVSRLVAVCPAGGHDGGSLGRKALRAAMATREDRLRFYHPRLMDMALDFVFAQPPWGPAWEGMPPVRARFHAQWGAPERPLLERSLVRAGQGVLAHPLLGRLAGLRAPVLLVEGRGDLVIPAGQTQALWPALPPASQRVKLPGGHMLPYRCPERLNQVLLPFLA